MTEPQPLPTERRLRSWTAPAALLASMLVLLVGVFVASRLTGGNSPPPSPDALSTPVPGSPFIAFDVEEITAERFGLVAGQDAARQAVEITLGQDVVVDFLMPADPDEIEPGDWVTVIGVPNPVRNFAIKMILIIPGGQTLDDGFARTPSQFLGHEAARESREVSILGGLVTAVTPDLIEFEAGGPSTIALTPETALRIVSPGKPDQIEPGDRLAMHTGDDGEADSSLGVLVLVGGGR